jgi:hypothetical protein
MRPRRGQRKVCHFLYANLDETGTLSLLFYGRAGSRLVGYDNERGKGDHRHIENREEAYLFTTPEALVEAFLSDVKALRGET